MLQTSDNGNNIYLSPHYDDAAFSLGAWIAAHPGGTLVNIFTRSGYVAGGDAGLWPDPAVVDRISSLRKAEDLRFSGGHGLEVIDLGLEEPSLRGRGPRDATGLDDDIAQVRGPLTEVLDQMAGAGGRTIFCPAGIGGHINHLAVRVVVLRWAVARGSERHLRFYEDLPYAARHRLRRPGLRDLRAALGGRPMQRTAWRAGSEKLAAINLYPSQHNGPRTSLARFSPRALWPWGAHEAVWTLTIS